MKTLFEKSQTALAVAVALATFSSGLLAETIDLGSQSVINKEVNHSGKDVIAPGNLSITGTGYLQTGTFTGKGKLEIQPNGSMTSSGLVSVAGFNNGGLFKGAEVISSSSPNVYNTGSMTLTGSFTNKAEQGVIYNRGSLDIAGNITTELQLNQNQGSLTFSGTEQSINTKDVILTGGTVTVNQGSKVDASNSAWQVSKDTKIDGQGTLIVGSMLNQENAEIAVSTLHATGKLDNRASLTSDTVIIDTTMLNNEVGVVKVGNLIAANGSSISNHGNMSVTSFQGQNAKLFNYAGATLAANQLNIGALTNNGILTLTGEDASLTIGESLINNGTVTIGQSLIATSATVQNNGTIKGVNDAALDEIKVLKFINGEKGTITVNQLTVTRDLNNSGNLTVNDDLIGPDSEGIITNRGTLSVGGNITAGVNLGAGKGNGVTNLGTLELTGTNQVITTNVLYNSKEGKVLSTNGALNVEGIIQNHGLIAKSDTEALTNFESKDIQNFETATINVEKMVANGAITNLGTIIASGEVIAQTLGNREGASVTAQSIKTSKLGHRGHLSNEGVMTIDGEVEVFGHFGNLNNGQFKAGTLITSNAKDTGKVFEVDNLNLTVSPETDKGLGYFDFESETSIAKIGNLTAPNGQLKVFGAGVEIGTVTDKSNVIFQVDDLKPGKSKVGTNNGNLSVEVPSEITDTFNPDNLTEGMQQVANTLTIEKGNLSKGVFAEAGTIIGDLEAQTDSTGNIVWVKESANEFNVGISEIASVSMMAWRAENNDLFKRLGDVRRGDDSNGLWTRIMAGESEYGHQNLENEYTTFQFGYDHRVGVANEWILGSAFTYTNGESTFKHGSGDNYQYGIALYGSYLAENGGYVDVIGKYSHLNNGFKATGGIGKGDYDGNGVSLSIETGYRFDVMSHFYVEPQAEFTYGYLTDVKYTTSAGAQVKQDSMKTAVTRLGFNLGKSFDKGNIHVGASYLMDWEGETSVAMTYKDHVRHYAQDLGDDWFEFEVGAAYAVQDNLKIYGTVETTTGGDVKTPWQANVGVRLTW